MERCGECGTLTEPPTCVACGGAVGAASLWSATSRATVPGAAPSPRQQGAPVAAVGAPAPGTAPPRRSNRSVAIVAGAVLLVGVVVGAFLVGRGSDDGSSGAPASAAATATDVRAGTAGQSAAPVASPAPLAPSPAVTPSPIVFPYDWYDVPPLNAAEPSAMGSGCDTENMGDGLWHGFVTSFDGQTMGFDRACALIPYALENKSDRVRTLSVSPAYAVYGATWTDTGCNSFVPAALDAGQPVWIGIEDGQIQWALMGCEG